MRRQPRGLQRRAPGRQNSHRSKAALIVFYSEYGLAPVSSGQTRSRPFSAPIWESEGQEGFGHNVRKTCPSHLVRIANCLQHSLGRPRKHFGSVGCTQCQGALAMKTPTTPVAKYEGPLRKEKQQLQQQKWGVRGKKAVNCNERPNRLPQLPLRVWRTFAVCSPGAMGSEETLAAPSLLAAASCGSSQVGAG